MTQIFTSLEKGPVRCSGWLATGPNRNAKPYWMEELEAERRNIILLQAKQGMKQHIWDTLRRCQRELEAAIATERQGSSIAEVCGGGSKGVQ